MTFVYIQLRSLIKQPCHKILWDLQLATDLYSKKHCPAFYVLDKSEVQSNVNQNESCLEILGNPICPTFFWIPPFLLNCSTEVVHHCTTICFNRWPLRHCFISPFFLAIFHQNSNKNVNHYTQTPPGGQKTPQGSIEVHLQGCRATHLSSALHTLHCALSTVRTARIARDPNLVHPSGLV